MMVGAIPGNVVKSFLRWVAGSWETRGGQELVLPLPGGYVKDMLSLLAVKHRDKQGQNLPY